MPELTEAKARLDKLIAKARIHLYKPIQIAEILYRHRVGGDLDVSNLTAYRRPSTRWRNEVVLRLLGRKPVLNSRYEDQLFDKSVLPPEQIEALATFNERNGIVEAYIYMHLLKRGDRLDEICEHLNTFNPYEFDLSVFIKNFEEDSDLCRSVDKAYEIIVYALFSAITKQLDATVTLAIQESAMDVLRDFEDFSRLVLGVDIMHPSVSVPAKLYRIGTTNANDGGLDMWANFGPAVQVKHMTLSPQLVGDIIGETMADQVVIVCKSSDVETIDLFLKQTGLDIKTRGVITETDLLRWHLKCREDKYRDTLCVDFVNELRTEFLNEFPINTHLQDFLQEREYISVPLEGIWEI